MAERPRETLAGEPRLVERAMFGGVGYLIEGNMAVGISGETLIVRVGPGAYDAALARPHARVVDMTWRPMGGWVMVDPAGLEDDAAIERSLPPKRATRNER